MTLRAGIVGLGRWANAHAAAAIRSDEVRLISCFTRTEARRQAFAEKHGVACAAASYDELLANPDIEAVVISTPNDAHVDMTIAALAAGKAVLVDKPVAVDLAEGLRLLRASDGAPPVAVAHHARRLAGQRALKSWLASDAAGTVRLAHATFSNDKSLPTDPAAWHRHARGAEAGVLIQVGIHQVDNVMDLLGPARLVNARFGYGELGPAIPTAATVVSEHSTGAVSTVTTSWTSPSYFWTGVQTDSGWMDFWQDHRFWTSPEVDDHGEVWASAAGGGRRQVVAPAGDPLRDQLDDLARAVRTGGAAGVTVIEGLRAIAVVEAAVRSAAGDGMPVAIAELAREAGATDSEVALLVDD